MSNGTDSKYRSRKFLIAASELLVVTCMAAWGCHLSTDAQDVALVIGAWGIIAAAIGKLYNDANLEDDSKS
jgi:hypothetical protein